MTILEVCVVAYRNEDTIGALIRSLTAVPGATLAIHDNGPQGSTLAAATRLAEQTGIVLRGERCADGNCGFGAGCNRLARSSAAAQVLFLNPDAAVRHWPTDLAAGGRIVGALVQTAEGEPAQVWGTRRDLRDEALLRWLRRKPERPAGTGYVSGAAMLIDRDTFITLGGFDERYFMYYEDIDLCRRANAAGVDVVLEPGWRVVHEGGHSVGRSAEALTRAHLNSYHSGRRFHAEQGRARGYDALVLADSTARAIAFRVLARRRADAAANAAVAGAALRSLAGGLRRRTS